MVLNKNSSFGGTVDRMLHGAFPLHYRPSIKIIGRQLAENRFKIHLSVTQRAESASTVYPVLITTVNALLAAWVELRILHMEHLNALVIMVDKSKIIHALKQEVRWVIKNACAFMIVHFFKKHLVGDSVVNIFTRVDFVTKVNALFVKRIQDRCPSFCKFGKTIVYQPCRTLRPGVDRMP